MLSIRAGLRKEVGETVKPLRASSPCEYSSGRHQRVQDAGMGAGRAIPLSWLRRGGNAVQFFLQAGCLLLALPGKPWVPPAIRCSTRGRTGFPTQAASRGGRVLFPRRKLLPGLRIGSTPSCRQLPSGRSPGPLVGCRRPVLRCSDRVAPAWTARFSLTRRGGG
jgi:hypothetical protein